MKTAIRTVLKCLLAVLALTGVSQAQTWSGSASNAWGTAGNWTPALPVSGGSLIFTSATGTGGLNLNNNLTSGSFSINAITFNAGAAAFVIGDGTTTANAGNTFVLAGNVTNSGTNLETINNPFSMTANRVFTTTTGGSIKLAGDISGTGGAIQTAGTGVLTLTGNNSFTGGVNLAGGTLNINSATALGSGTLTIGNGTTFNNTTSGALTLTTNNAISFGTALYTYGGTQDLNFGTGTVTAAGGGIILNGNSRTLTFGGTLTNSATSNGGFAFYNSGGGSKVVLGGFSVNADTASDRAVSIGGTADVTITGAVVGGGRATHILAQSGTGTLTLQGNATAWTGALRTLGPGTIKIDGSTATMSGSNAVQLNVGGTINYDNTASTGARTVSFGALSFGAGEGVFQSTRTAAQDVTVTFASLGTRGATASGNIVSSGGTNGTNNTVRITAQAAGFMNGALYYNGADFAAMSAAGGSGGFVRGLAYGTDTNTVAVNTITSNKHVKLTATQAVQNTISLLTLNLSGSSDFTLNAAQTLTISSLGLLKSGGGSGTLSGGAGLSQTTELVVRTDTASDLVTISNTITSSAGNAVTKSGAGTLVLTGTNSYTGTTTINNGALRAIDGTGLATSSILQLRGGVFESNGTFTRTVGTAAGNVNWSTSSGGFAANGGTLNLNLNGGTASLTWNGSSMVADARELVFGSATADSMVDFQNAFNLGSGNALPRTIRVLDNAGSANDKARISGAITNTTAGMSIIKEGAGVLELTSNANTYSGGTTVNAGTLLVNNTSGTGTGTGALSVSAGAVLGGTGSISGSTTIGGSLRPGNSIGTLTVTNDVIWNAGNDWVFELGTAATTMALAGSGSSTQDMLNLTGGSSDFLKGTGSTWTFDFAGGGALGWYKLVDWAGTTDFSAGLNTQFAAINLGGGYTGAFTVDSATSALYLNVVPEPATLTLLAFSLTAALVLRRRRC